MTENQFKYKQLEQARDQLAEQKRHSIVSEAIESGKLSETIRHQQMQESIDRAKADETLRHNLEAERLNSESNRTARVQARASQTSSRASMLKSATEAAYKPKYYELDSAANRTNINKTISDINVNDRNASTREYEAETKRLQWMTSTVLDTGNFIMNSLGTAGGLIGKMAAIL